MSQRNEQRRLVYLPLFILNLCLHVVDSIRGLDLKGDGLASKSLNEDLHGVLTVVVGVGNERAQQEKRVYILPWSEIEIGTAMLSHTNKPLSILSARPHSSRTNQASSEIIQLSAQWHKRRRM